MNARRGLVNKLAWLGLAAALTLACSSDKKTLLLVDVSLLPGVAAPTSVTIDVATAGGPLGSEDFDWAEAKNGILQAGVYLPDGVVGTVTVTATGKAGGVAQSRDSKPAEIIADKTNGPVALALGSIEAAGDAGADAASVSPDSGVAEVAGDAGRLPDTAKPGSEVGGNDASDDDGGMDASVSDAPERDANLSLVDGSVEDGLGAGGDATGVVAWEPAENVEKDPVARSSYPVIVVEPILENVIVAWYENSKVKVLRYDRKAGTWGAVKTIESRGLPSQVAIGADASGNVIVAWVQQYTGTDASLHGVWVSQSSDGIAWSPAVQVATGKVFTLTFGMARNGTARMAWTRETGTNMKGVFTAAYDKSSWKADPAPVLDPNDPGVVDPDDPNPQLAVGGTGDAILVFDMDDASKNTSVGVVTLTGATRSAARLLDTYTAGHIYAENRSVAMNANGEGVVVWAENGSTSAALNLSYYKPSSSWTSVQKVTDGDEFYSLGSALDNNGNITVAWVQGFASGGHNVMAIHGKVGGAWGQATALETDNMAAGNYNEFATPMLAADGFGNVLAVWQKKINATTYGAYARRLQGTTWQPQVKLGQKADHKTLWPRVAVADSGFGAATFEYYAGSDPEAYNVEVAFCR
jgi:hypothetical protein